MEFFKKFLHRFLYPASLIYTVLSLLTFAAFFIFGSDKATRATAVAFLLIALYAAFVAFVNLIFYTQMIMPIKIPSHFLCTFIPFYLAMKTVFTTTYLIPVIAFIVLYVAICTATLIIKSKKKEKERDSKKYKKLYTK